MCVHVQGVITCSTACCVPSQTWLVHREAIPRKSCHFWICHGHFDALQTLERFMRLLFILGIQAMYDSI